MEIGFSELVILYILYLIEVENPSYGGRVVFLSSQSMWTKWRITQSLVALSRETCYLCLTRVDKMRMMKIYVAEQR